MNCKQVNSLSFAYCENEINPATRLELEKHIAECPECRKIIDFTARETEALRSAADIPELPPNFSHNIVMGVRGKYKSRIPRPGYWFTKKRLRAITNGNIIGASMAAVLLLSWLFVPGVRESLMGTNGSSPNQLATTEIIQDAQNSTAKVAATDLMTGAQEKSQKSGQVQFSLPDSLKWAPDYSLNPTRKVAGRSAVVKQEGSLLLDNEAIKVPIFQPIYLPDGYKLADAVPDPEGNCTLSYADKQGDLISLKIQQNLPASADISYGSPALAAKALPNGPGVSNSQPGVVPEASDQATMLKAAPTSEAASKVGSDQVKTEIAEPAANSAAANLAASKPATMIWTIENNGTLYNLELSGTLGPEELGKVASSVKLAE